jgi:hypothetical protein
MRRWLGVLLAGLLIPGVALAAAPQSVRTVRDPGTPRATANQIVSARPEVPSRAYRIVKAGPGHYDTVAPVRKSFLPELERSELAR